MGVLHSLMACAGRHRLIRDRDGNEPYMDRYYLFLRSRDTFPFNVFLHRILKSDPDEMHDHPWAYRSLVLRGGYWEHTPHGTRWRGPLSYRFAPADSVHRIEIDPAKPPCWTLFIPGRRVRDWGFHRGGQWVHNEVYLAARQLQRLAVDG